MANRVSAAGMVVAVVVGLALVAIVEQQLVSSGRNPDDDRKAIGKTPGPSPSPSVRSAEHRPEAVTPTTLLSRKVQMVALTVRMPALRKEFGTTAVPRPVVRVSRTDARRTWAFGTEAIAQPPRTMSMPDTSLYVAHLVNDRWQVGLAGTTQFAALLKHAPAAVAPPAERAMLAKYNAAKVASAAGLMLPWTVGQSWTLLPTGTGAAGFSGGDGRVLAAGDGRLYRLCSKAADRGLILIIHPNGMATEYYQMSTVTGLRDGSRVNRGTYLGQTGTEQPCGGGQAAQQMVRFALRNATTSVALNGVQVGGWMLRQTPADVSASRTGVRVNAGNPLLNFGVSASPAPGPLGLAVRTAASGRSIL